MTQNVYHRRTNKNPRQPSAAVMKGRFPDVQVYTPFLLLKMGYVGVYMSWVCYPDDSKRVSS